MATRTPSDVSAHLRFRRATLAEAAEWMFAALQVHVDGCPRCRDQVCSDATHDSVGRIREALRRDAAARSARG